MKLIIVRHGVTDENVKGICQGHYDSQLNEEGRQQAEAVGKRLVDEQIDAIYSSDLSRAADTAKAIAQHHPEIEVQFTEVLREQHMGKFQQKTRDEINRDEFLRLYRSPGVIPETGESYDDMLERAQLFLHEARVKHKGETVVVVTHSGIKKALVHLIMGTEYHEIEFMHNTSVSVFEVGEDEGYKMQLLNCVAHLDDSL